ncbi:myrosinase-binding protein 2 [Drosophila serrata]|uniref:myrosinase-binding protein 2 n=1 Tax=Drosophila serrata TaxID=7274 RepID=UPI000A1D3497|nr:myrosinase-binding protein 2 [Drosophila serrata]
MKFLTIFAFACVASFVVLHGVSGVPVPAPEPNPVPDPAPKAEPVANPKPVAGPSPLPAASPMVANGPQDATASDGNFVALSANAEPMVLGQETASLKNDENLAI